MCDWHRPDPVIDFFFGDSIGESQKSSPGFNKTSQRWWEEMKMCLVMLRSWKAGVGRGGGTASNCGRFLRVFFSRYPLSWSVCKQRRLSSFQTSRLSLLLHNVRTNNVHMSANTWCSGDGCRGLGAVCTSSEVPWSGLLIVYHSSIIH